MKIHTKNYRTIFKQIFLVILLIVAGFQFAPAQSGKALKEIFLLDQNKQGYIEFLSSDIRDYYYPEKSSKYPSVNLFDGNLKSCWVSNQGKSNATLFLKLPTEEPFILNIFSGYGKSNNLFSLNARPENLLLKLYAAIGFEGFDTETGIFYQALELPGEEKIHLDDHFGIQSFQLNFSQDKLSELKGELLKHYKEQEEFYFQGMRLDEKPPISDSCFILQIDISGSYPGKKYEDICVSELFFNDRYISSSRRTISELPDSIYLNQEENILLANTGNQFGQILYSDSTAILQIADVSDNKKWALLISMPDEIEGRVETSYLLVDLSTGQMINAKFKQCTGIDLSFHFPEFKNDEYGKTYLLFDDGEKVELGG